jgi:hypothetical protein
VYIYIYRMLYIPSFMNTGTGVQAILKFCLKILRCAVLVLLMWLICEISYWDELGRHDIHTKFHEDRLRRSWVITGRTHTNTQTARWLHKSTFIFSLLSLFWKEIKVDLWNYLTVCVSVNPAFEFLNGRTKFYETWYVYHGTWVHLYDVLRKFLPLVCVSLCVSCHC